MKYLLLFFFLFILISCSSKKKIIIEKKQTKETILTKKAETIEVAKDTITEKTITQTVSKKIKKDTPKENTKKPDSIYFIKITSHDNWNELLKKHVNNSGNIDYKGFKTDEKKLRNYIKHLANNMPSDGWMKNHKLSYWINAYNAMTIDLILRYYPIKSIKDIKNPWDQRFWKFGDKWYNLNDIEHQILRKMNEPRIHFAIVCASYSCPKLQNKAYSNINLEKQLTQVTKDFLADSERNIISENNIQISKIFQWFAKDFKQNGSLIDFLNQYSTIKISAKAKKTFKDYNWDLNE